MAEVTSTPEEREAIALELGLLLSKELASSNKFLEEAVRLLLKSGEDPEEVDPEEWISSYQSFVAETKVKKIISKLNKEKVNKEKVKEE